MKNVGVLGHHKSREKWLWFMMNIALVACGETAVITGNGGQARSTVVEVTMNGQLSTPCRPISCLYSLEVMLQSDTYANNSSGTDDNKTVNEVDSPVTHTLNQRAQQQVHKWMTEQTEYY